MIACPPARAGSGQRASRPLPRNLPRGSVNALSWVLVLENVSSDRNCHRSILFTCRSLASFGPPPSPSGGLPHDAGLTAGEVGATIGALPSSGIRPRRRTPEAFGPQDT